MPIIYLYYNILQKVTRQGFKYTFQPCVIGEKPQICSKSIIYHIIFEVKMDLQHKSRLVTNGNRNEGSTSHIQIIPLLSAMSLYGSDSYCQSYMIWIQYISILAMVILNIHIHKTREKAHVYNGIHLFGHIHYGKTDIIVSMIYDIITSNTILCFHDQYTLQCLIFDLSYIDHDIYMKPYTILEDDVSHTMIHTYIVSYIDDLLIVSLGPFQINDTEYMFNINHEGIKGQYLYLRSNTTE